MRKRNKSGLPYVSCLVMVLCFLTLASPARCQRGEFYQFPPDIEQHRPKRDIFPGNRFTFCRIQFTNERSGRSGGPWWTDYPDSDLNFPLRLGELTTLDVNRDNVIVRLTDKELYDYPFIYMLEVGTLVFQENELKPLRSYLLRGGFLMVDDFWGEREWKNWQEQISRVLPPEDFPIVDIPLTHELFHCVFDIKEPPQVPGIENWRAYGLSYERPDAKECHCRGIFDQNHRLMVVIMHNTDLGDGWEREGEDAEYFREFSAKRAYPMGVNIVVYAMTH